jgi:hypothetical protein
MTDDIAAQLRNLNPWEDPRWPEVLREGADEIERLLLIEQGAAEPCDTCGWRMKFPNEECRNCENAKLRDENERLRVALFWYAECYCREGFNADCCGTLGDDCSGCRARAALEGEKKDG